MLSTKEGGLLKDLKNQEEICIAKYRMYATQARSKELSELFSSIEATEREHLKTINEIAGGGTPVMPQNIGNSNNDNCAASNYRNEKDKNDDALLCRDMLSSEKHVSSVYDTSIFEFTSPENRRTLNHIQAEEQQHGEKLYTYMKNNNMYN